MTSSSSLQETLDKQLLHACRYGRVQDVDILLLKNANIHFTDENDPFCASCLSEACRRGNANIVQLLLKKGAKATDKISHDITPLHIACERGHLNIVNVLLSSFISSVVKPENNAIEEKNKHSQSSAAAVAANIASNMDTNEITEKNTNNVINIIVQNINLLTCNLSSAQELFNLDTPLHFAAANNHSDICKVLINKGNAEINVQNRTGDTPLHCAVVNDRTKSTKMLLELGADITIKNYAEMTPITVARMAKCQKTFNILQAYVFQMQEKAHKKTKDLSEETDSKLLTIDNKNLNSSTSFSIFDSLTPRKADKEVLVFHSKRNMSYKKGWLRKQGKNFKTYHDRYFILYANGLMKYYTKELSSFASLKKRRSGSSTKSFLFNDEEDDDSEDDRQMNLLLDKHPNAFKKKTILPYQETLLENNASQSTSNSSSKEIDFLKEEMNNANKNTKIKSKGKKMTLKRWSSSNRITPRKKSTLARVFHSASNSHGNMSNITQKGIIDLNDFIETQFLAFEDNSIGFAIITNEREWKFKCKTDVERREWIASVHAVILGISHYDLPNLGMQISYQNGTMLMQPSRRSFLFDDNTSNMIVAAGWMFKMGAAVSGLEKSYWKKRWVSLYDKPGKLTYAEHPYCESSNEKIEVNEQTEVNENVSIKNDANVSYTTTLKVESPSIGVSGVKAAVKKRKKWSLSTAPVSSGGLKGSILLSDVNLIIKIENSDLILHKYRSPTIHVFALLTEKRTWVFACKTLAECTLWYERIKFFIPNQWKQNVKDLNLEELLKYNRVNTVANLNEFMNKNNNYNENENEKEEKQSNKSKHKVISKILRKISHMSESIGITEPYSSISSVQPRGTITTYNDIDRMVHKSDQHLVAENTNGQANVDNNIDLAVIADIDDAIHN